MISENVTPARRNGWGVKKHSYSVSEKRKALVRLAEAKENKVKFALSKVASEMNVAVQLLSRWVKEETPAIHIAENNALFKLHPGPKVQLPVQLEEIVMHWATDRREMKLKVNPRLMSIIAKQKDPSLRGI